MCNFYCKGKPYFNCFFVCLFVLGTTRNNFEGKKVISLEYEAYLPMAENEVRKICSDLRQKWPVRHIAVFHRLGYDFFCQFKVKHNCFPPFY